MTMTAPPSPPSLPRRKALPDRPARSPPASAPRSAPRSCPQAFSPRSCPLPAPFRFRRGARRRRPGMFVATGTAAERGATRKGLYAEARAVPFGAGAQAATRSQRTGRPLAPDPKPLLPLRARLAFRPKRRRLFVDPEGGGTPWCQRSGTHSETSGCFGPSTICPYCNHNPPAAIRRGPNRRERYGGSSSEAGARPSRNDALDGGGMRSPSSSPDSQLPCCNVRPSVSLFQKQTAVTAVRVYACLMLTYFCMDLTTKGLCPLDRAKVFTVPPLLVQTISLGDKGRTCVCLD